MSRARLMSEDEDYERLGLKRGEVETWEDGLRDTDESLHWGWWYFDAMLDDGRTLLVQFLQKGLATVADNVWHPSVSFKVTDPDGAKHMVVPEYAVEDCSWSKECCDVHYGPNYFTGDLHTYHIHAEVAEGLGCDITLTSTAKPYRPETGYFEFGEDYYTWLCAVPRGEVSGTLTVDGETAEVHGRGYHDHQWGSNVYMLDWNHWIWARQAYDDYALLLFPMTASEPYGFERFPIVFVQDASGNIVFESSAGGKTQVLEEYVDEETGKPYPAKMRYVFEKDGARLEYVLQKKEVLEAADAMKMATPQMRAVFEQRGMQPSYARYRGQGDMRLELPGKPAVERSAELIYEMMYPGKTYKVSELAGE